MSDRQFLVLVRAGDNSLHPGWLAGNAPRSWDLIVNYFGNDPDIYRHDDIVRIDSKGPKWPALHDVLASHPEFFDRYTHIWLPDDDLAADLDSVNRLFATCVRYGFEVAQPALTWDSYTSHMVTLQHRNSLIRYTNFIEIMAPCFTAAMLRKALPLFDGNLSGWGLDFVWQKLADNPDTGLAIIDTVTVRHTRPIGGPNYKALQEKGTSPYDEREAFWKKYDIDPKILVHKAIDRQGRILESSGRKVRFTFRLLRGCAGALFKTPNAKGLRYQIYHFIRTSMTAAG